MVEKTLLKKLPDSEPAGYFDGERREMLEYVPVDLNSLLEVGCGTGNFGRLVKAKRPDAVVWGVEMSPAAATEASTKLDTVVTGDFLTAAEDLRDTKFDAICFNDVLEHMVYPSDALIEARQLLTDRGVVIASIPNILYFPVITNVLIAQDWKYEESGTLDRTHLRFFTRKSILRMFEDAGYQVEAIVGIKPSATKVFRIVNLLLLNQLSDWRYLQFAVIAKPVRR